MGTNSYVTKLKAQLNQAITQREHWKQLAENRNSIVVTEVCPESRSVEEYVIDADSVRASWRLIREYREQIEALRAERDALSVELEAIKGQQPVAFYWQDAGYPDPRRHGPFFGWPSESALRNVDGVAIPVPLYAMPTATQQEQPRQSEGEQQ